MEHVDVINRIIDAEHKARQIAEEARKKKQNLPQDLQSATESIRKTHMDRAAKRLTIVQDREQDLSNEELEKINLKFQQESDRMEVAFSRLRNEWADKLFSMVIGR